MPVVAPEINRNFFYFFVLFGSGREPAPLLRSGHMPKTVYIVAGELSGDVHGAGLIASLQEQVPDLRVLGAGGPRLKKLAGEGLCDWIEDSAVMGLWEVLKHYGWFKQQFARMLAEVVACRPDVLLLVDYPGYNLRFAKAVREILPQTKIIYYISPQVWAWNKGRIPKMVKLLDQMMCLFPFEEPIFSEAGLKTTFVGHPLVDELEAARESLEREQNLIALLPGSREREVSRLFPVMLESAAVLSRAEPHLQFEAPAASPKLAELMRNLSAAAGMEAQVRITDGGSLALMQRAGRAVIASGTATLEAAYYGLPYCLVYKVAAPTYWLGKMLIKIDYIGLVNILAGRAVVKEFIQDEATAEKISKELQRLGEDREYREAMVRSLAETSARLGGLGAHQRAAAVVADWLKTP